MLYGRGLAGGVWTIQASAKPYGGSWQETPDTLSAAAAPHSFSQWPARRPRCIRQCHGRYGTRTTGLALLFRPPPGPAMGAGKPFPTPSPRQDTTEPTLTLLSMQTEMLLLYGRAGSETATTSSRPQPSHTKEAGAVPDTLSSPDLMADFSRAASGANGGIASIWRAADQSFQWDRRSLQAVACTSKPQRIRERRMLCLNFSFIPNVA